MRWRVKMAKVIGSAEATGKVRELYIEYGKYVYETRALPGLVDGLKHGQRRLLLTSDMLPKGKISKSAKIVGDCLQYHAHSDSSVYGSLVSMTTETNRFRQFVGKGNFGGNGIACASMRYTGACLSEHSRYGYTQFVKYADYILGEAGLMEPEYLPALVPYCNIIGSSGIGVGMTTNILPLNLMELIDYYIAVIKGKTPKAPTPDFGPGIMIDLDDSQIDATVETAKSWLAVRSIITQESATELVIENIYNRSLDNVLKKLNHLIRADKLDFRDESGLTTRYVFEILDKSVSLNEVRSIIENATISRCSFTRILTHKGKAVYSSLRYQVDESLAYLNKVIDRKFQKDTDDLTRQRNILLVIEYIKSSGILARITQMTTQEVVDELLQTKKFELEPIKSAISKPLTYMTKSHVSELKDIEDKLLEIKNTDRTEYLVSLYKNYKKLLRPLYNESGHTLRRSQLLTKPLVSVDAKKNQLIVSNKGKAFDDGSLIIVTKDGTLVPRTLNATTSAIIDLVDIEGAVDVETRRQQYVVMLTNKEGILAVGYDDIRYAKKVINLDEGEYIERILDLDVNNEFEYGGLTYKAEWYYRKRVSKPIRRWTV